MKTCSKCKKEFPATNEYFHNHTKSKDGLYPSCKTCKNSYSKTPKGIDVRNKKIYKRYKKHPHKKLAKEKVHYAVKVGKLPKVSTLNCLLCDNYAQEYHHWSYDIKNLLDVIPLCKKCHTRVHHNDALMREVKNDYKQIA